MHFNSSFKQDKITLNIPDPYFSVSVWALYSSSKNLVILECYKPNNGSCRYDDAFIEVLSRTHNLEEDQRGQVYDAMTNKCFGMSDYIAARQTGKVQFEGPLKKCLAFFVIQSNLL